MAYTSRHTHTHITNTQASVCTCTHLNTQNTGRKLRYKKTDGRLFFFFSRVNRPNVPSSIGSLFYLRNIVFYFLLLFQFAMSWDLWIWLQCITIHVRFILTTLKKKGVWNCFPAACRHASHLTNTLFIACWIFAGGIKDIACNVM